MALTDTAVRKFKKSEERQLIADGKGLYLKVDVSGTKTWMLRSQKGGSGTWMTLGVYPVMTLQEARADALSKASAVLSGKVTIQYCYDEWVTRVIKRTYKSPVQVEWRAGKYYLPQLGTRTVSAITRAELSKLLAKLAETAPVSANRVLTDLKLLFTYAVERGWLEDSPAAVLTQKIAGGREITRDRVMSDEELTTFISWLVADRFADKTRLALALLLTTGMRSGEVRGVRRSDFLDTFLKLPPQRTKNGSAHVVNGGGCINVLLRFTFNHLGKAPFDDAAGLGMPNQVLGRAMNRMAFSPTATPHDLRRTMATWMADHGVAPHIVEKCLNHKMTGVMAIYNRAEYAAEKHAAWRLWTQHLLRLRKKCLREQDSTGG